MNNPTEIFCEACQKEASIPHGEPLVCPHCQGEHVADADSEPIVETPPPPQLPPPPLPKPLMTEAQMTIALLRSIKEGVDTIKILMIIFAILSFIGALVIQGNAPRSRW